MVALRKVEEEIASECNGCERITLSHPSKKRVCCIFNYPRVQWWFDEYCKQATHCIQPPPHEDPIKEP